MQATKKLASSSTIVLVISHKEALLDKLVDRILYINSEKHTLTTFHNCRYSDFRSILEAQRAHAGRVTTHAKRHYQQAQSALTVGDLQKTLRKKEGNLKSITSQNSDQRFIRARTRKPSKRRIGRPLPNPSTEKANSVATRAGTSCQARTSQTKYTVRHFLLEAPQTVTIAPALADQLNAHNVYAANPVVRFPERYASDTPVVVQRVPAAPDPTLLFRCVYGKYPERRPARDDFFGAVADSTFYPRLQDELAHIMAVLHKEAWLTLDFQLLVDTQGRVYCIDCGMGKFKKRYKKRKVRDWLGYCRGESDVLLNQTRVWFQNNNRTAT